MNNSTGAGWAIEAILFDKDGTLADARLFLRNLAISRAKACAEILKRKDPRQSTRFFKSLCRAFGVVPTGLDPDGLMAVGTRHANEQAVVDLMIEIGDPGAEATKRVTKIFSEVDGAMSSKAAQTPMFSGTRTMLQKLYAKSLKVGVLSSDSSSQVHAFLEHYELDSLVTEWRGTDRGDKPKPDPHLFWEMCDRMQVPPERTLMVGDSWADLEVARNAKAAAFVSVSEGWGRSPLGEADHIIYRWDDLLQLLEDVHQPHGSPE